MRVVNSVAWAPHDIGLVLACASSDGHISVLTWKAPNEWTAVKFAAHQVGVNAVSWAPGVSSGALLQPGAPSPVPCLASGGCDCLVKVRP